MARRRLIIHGSLEELEMFEPIYNTRLRLQHGAASTSRFQLPDPATSVESEQEVEDEGAVTNSVQRADQEGNEVPVETPCNWRNTTSDDEDLIDNLPDNIPHSTTRTDDQVGFANNGNTGLQAGNGSQTPASPSPVSESDTDSDSDS